MFRTMMAGLALGAGLMLAGATAAATTPDQVTIKTGALKGVVTDDVVAFKGIPYAAPPVGPLRWKPPQPAAHWTGVKDASAFGPACVQGGAGGANSAEDCLTVNVWAPANHKGHKLPVMVWIHGGGFIGGSGSSFIYDGTHFAKDGVVLVSLNYRLGRLGFFAHPALTKENPKGPLGNYGLMDQVAALKWVRANIAAFGGDPHNVTAFGESAGGISVNFLMDMPNAKSLFDKVISESGFGRFDAPPIAVLEKADAEYAAKQGVSGDDAAAAAALRALPADKLLGSISGLTDPGVPRPMIDGTIIKERVDQAFAKGHQAKIPYMLGGNSYEASLFARDTAAHPDVLIAGTGMDKERAMTLFGDGDKLKAAYNISTETMISEPNRDLASKDATAHVPVYLYYFAYVPAAARATTPGAGHGSELTYVFETLPLKPMSFGGRQIPAATPEDLAISKTMHAYWVAFAKTGDPGAAGGVRWPRYDPATDELMEFSENGAQVQDRWLHSRLDVIEAKVNAPAAH